MRVRMLLRGLGTGRRMLAIRPAPNAAAGKQHYRTTKVNMMSGGGSEDRPHKIDLRSDTVTRPTQAMYEAMIAAPVGDDVMLEDPTVLDLEKRCAKLFNKEDALFVPTGTMGNLVSLMTHCSERGQEVIMGKMNHIFLYEVGGLAQIAGVHTNTVMNREDGTVDVEEVRRNIRDVNDDHMPRTRVICTENTHNRCGGLILPLSHFQEIRKVADDNGLAVHMDGARILHACVAQGREASDYTNHVDSISMCFSKGLGCPVGSIIAGTADFCKKSRKTRKALGGGMRQIGVLAAAAMYALDNNVQRLKEDHSNAKMLARVVADNGGEMARVDMDKVHTNIVYVNLLKPKAMNAKQLVERLNKVTEKEKQSLGFSAIMQTLPFSESDVRFVCHLNATNEEVLLAANKLKYVLEEINQ